MSKKLHSAKDYSGCLITFEGGEGGGKTTQAPLVMDKLKTAGHEVVSLREPGGTNVSEQIREVVLSPKNKDIAFTTEVLLFQAARAQIYDELVLPALREGKVVLMDRSRDSSVVYQGIVRGFGEEFIEQLNEISTQGTMPKLTILLDLPTEVGLERREKDGGMDRLDMEKRDFHEQVRQAYLHLAKKDNSGRWAVVDAGQSLEKVTADIWQLVQKAV